MIYSIGSTHQINDSHVYTIILIIYLQHIFVPQHNDLIKKEMKS